LHDIRHTLLDRSGKLFNRLRRFRQVALEYAGEDHVAAFRIADAAKFVERGR
jgi:hypothetical protein